MAVANLEQPRMVGHLTRGLRPEVYFYGIVPKEFHPKCTDTPIRTGPVMRAQWVTRIRGKSGWVVHTYSGSQYTLVFEGMIDEITLSTLQALEDRPWTPAEWDAAHTYLGVKPLFSQQSYLRI